MEDPKIRAALDCHWAASDANPLARRIPRFDKQSIADIKPLVVFKYKSPLAVATARGVVGAGRCD